MVTQPSVHVLVLGDVSRSPRIKNHATSFAKEGWRVKFSGYSGRGLALNKDNVTYCCLREPPAFFDNHLPRVFSTILRLFFLVISLFLHLVLNMREDILFLQSPPAVPTLFVVYFFAIFKRCPVCIDWHNYGYSIMEVSFGPNNPATKIYKLLELSFASRCLQSDWLVQTRHFTVSKALSSDLRRRACLEATVVYDRPTKDFEPTKVTDAHKLFLRLSKLYPQLKNPDRSENGTIFTDVDPSGGGFKWRKNRPALVVSSCSWSPDDDFLIMLKALDRYNATVGSLPDIGFHKLFCVITGRGPLKKRFQELIARQNWTHVEVLTPWLEWSDYTLLLGAADLGVSLHRSTSDLDLPMKIVDLIGSQVPVLALAYPALSELLPDKAPLGYQFHTPEELASLLTRLLMPTPAVGQGVGEAPDLVVCRSNLAELNRSPDMHWHTYWRQNVLPVCEKLAPEKR